MIMAIDENVLHEQHYPCEPVQLAHLASDIKSLLSSSFWQAVPGNSHASPCEAMKQSALALARSIVDCHEHRPLTDDVFWIETATMPFYMSYTQRLEAIIRAPQLPEVVNLGRSPQGWVAMNAEQLQQLVDQLQAHQNVTRLSLCVDLPSLRKLVAPITMQTALRALSFQGRRSALGLILLCIFARFCIRGAACHFHVVALSCCLGHFYCLIGFSYAENDLGPVGGAHIAESLKELTMLQTLHLSGTSEMQDFSVGGRCSCCRRDACMSLSCCCFELLLGVLLLFDWVFLCRE